MAEHSGKAAMRDAADQFSEDVAKFYAEMLKADKNAWAFCTKCRKKVEVPVPDWTARAKAIETLLSHGWGKPAAQKEAEAPLKVSSLAELEGLSDEELARIAEG